MKLASYSMENMCGVADGSYPKLLLQTVEAVWLHIQSCALCQGQGFFCELCRGQDVLFGFMPESVVFCCPACHACFHKSCVDASVAAAGLSSGTCDGVQAQFICPRCVRFNRRREQRDAEPSVLHGSIVE